MLAKQRGMKRRRKSRGQAVVEFALMMVFFLLILLAVLDLGRAYLTSVALENAAAEGAMFAMANPLCLPLPSPCVDPDTVTFRVQHESTGGLLVPEDVQVVWSAPPYDPGYMVAVTVSYPFHPIIPLVSAFGADPITLTSSAKQLIP